VLGAFDGLSGTSTNDKLTASVFGSMMGGNMTYIFGGLILLIVIILLLLWLEKRRKEKEGNNIK